MNKYLLVYSGGGMPETEEEQAAVMADWMAWFGTLGEAVVDGGDPTMPMPKTVSPGGMVADGAAGTMVSGYSVLQAASLDEAVEMAKGCPTLGNDGKVTVYELIDSSAM